MKVVIVAAGTGSRFGSDVPKQFCLLGERPVLMRSIERFTQAVDFNDIYVVVSKEMKEFWLDLCSRYRFTSPKVVFGGTTRLNSVWNALKAIRGEGDYNGRVMIHDGARPLISKDLIDRLIAVPAGHQAIPGVPVTDSLRCRRPDGLTEAVDRSRYFAVQTPQLFDFKVLYNAYEEVSAANDRTRFTDDASVVEAFLGKPVEIIKGEPSNIKITNPLDIAVAEAILKVQS